MTEYLAVIPLVCVWFGGILTMIAEAFRSPGEQMPMEGIAVGVLMTSAVTGVLLWGRGAVSFGVVSADNFGLFVTLVLAVVACSPWRCHRRSWSATRSMPASTTR